MTDREALKLALEALEFFGNNASNPAEEFITSKAISALRKALLQPECNPHPDAPHGFNRESSHSLGRYVCDCEGWDPEREWQGLTDEEIQDFGYEAEKFDKSNSEWFDRFGFARAIEAKLKEKNHD